VEQGGVIIRQGDPASDACYFIRSGAVAVEKRAQQLPPPSPSSPPPRGSVPVSAPRRELPIGNHIGGVYATSSRAAATAQPTARDAAGRAGSVDWGPERRRHAATTKEAAGGHPKGFRARHRKTNGMYYGNDSSEDEDEDDDVDEDIGKGGGGGGKDKGGGSGPERSGTGGSPEDVSAVARLAAMVTAGSPSGDHTDSDQSDEPDGFGWDDDGQSEDQHTRAAQEAVEVLRLGPGQQFGERGMLFNEPRAASVRAIERCELLKIDRGTFESFLGSTQSLMEAYVIRMEAQEIEAGLSFGQLGIGPVIGSGSFSTCRVVRVPVAPQQQRLSGGGGAGENGSGDVGPSRVSSDSASSQGSRGGVGEGGNDRPGSSSTYVYYALKQIRKTTVSPKLLTTHPEPYTMSSKS